jgi:hypothetical protein
MSDPYDADPSSENRAIVSLFLRNIIQNLSSPEAAKDWLHALLVTPELQTGLRGGAEAALRAHQAPAAAPDANVDDPRSQLNNPSYFDNDRVKAVLEGLMKDGHLAMADVLAAAMASDSPLHQHIEYGTPPGRQPPGSGIKRGAIEAVTVLL